jgi:hypothetical protein
MFFALSNDKTINSLKKNSENGGIPALTKNKIIIDAFSLPVLSENVLFL